MSVKIQQLHNTNILTTFSLSCIPAFVFNTLTNAPSARRVKTAQPQTYISLVARTLNTGHQPAYVAPSFLKLTLMAAQKHYTLSRLSQPSASPAFRFIVPRRGLVCQKRRIMGQLVIALRTWKNMYKGWQNNYTEGKKKVRGRNIYSLITLSTRLTYTALESNPGLCGKKQATNSMSWRTALAHCTFLCIVK